MHKAEQLLKLVQTPEELLEPTMEEMSKDDKSLQAGSTIELQKILELKGLKKAEMDRVMDAMRVRACDVRMAGACVRARARIRVLARVLVLAHARVLA